MAPAANGGLTRATERWQSMTTARRVVIIGNGVAGITAALDLRELQPDWLISVVSDESDAFYSRPALMYLYMGHMRLADTEPYEEQVWDRQRITRVRDRVTGIDTDAREVTCASGASLAYDLLLLATGSESNRFGWPGQDLERVQGLYGLADVASLERATPDLERAVIVGGGLIGVELAEMLHTRGIAVTMLVREQSYWNNVLPDDESAIVNQVIRDEGIDLRLQTELAEIRDDGHGRAGGVVTGDGEEIACQFVGLTAGVHPNLSAVAGSGIPTGRGILVDRCLRTEVPGVFAAGDCAEVVDDAGDSRLWQVWYSGRSQGAAVARVMAGGEEPWQPGIWFNSAKFFDLEWQTYGQISCGLRRDGDPRTACIYWEHPDRRHAVRLELEDGVVVGVNTLGIRLRHRVCERWIAEGWPADRVIADLSTANFDPEFFARHEAGIAHSFREQLT